MAQSNRNVPVPKKIHWPGKFHFSIFRIFFVSFFFPSHVAASAPHSALARVPDATFTRIPIILNDFKAELSRTMQQFIPVIAIE